MTSTATDARPDLRGAALGVALTGVAAACWFVAARQMRGMDMGPGASLGSLSFFTATWATMMAAMMLPSAVPAVLAFDRSSPRRTVPSVLFVVGYLAVWTAVGVAAFFAYLGVRAAHLDVLAWDRDGAYVAGAAVVAAGVYELAPLKRACLLRCRGPITTRGSAREGLRYAGNCVGCSAGLMLVLFAVGVMSVVWMLIVALLVFVQKVPAGGVRLVTPVASLLVGLGVWIALAPSSVPGLTLPM